MAGYDLKLEVRKNYRDNARDFLEFIKSVARKYPVTLSYRSTSLGRFQVSLGGSPGAKIDSLLLEMILNRGLYYYFSSLRSPQRGLILREAILPVFQALIESRFPVPYSRFLRRHTLGRLPQDSFVPGDLTEESAHGYEILFRKWDIGIMGDWNFVKDADSLITNFLLTQIRHPPGGKSPKFPALLSQAYQAGIAMDRDTRRDFDAIHAARTGGLHRLQSLLNHKALAEIATRLYIYFEYFDEFHYSQLLKTEKLHGKRYRRIPLRQRKVAETRGVGRICRQTVPRLLRDKGPAPLRGL
jgi:hypothetical protein